MNLQESLIEFVLDVEQRREITMKISQKSINPNNKNQARLFYDLIDATRKAKESRHPQIVMKELSIKNNFTILGAVPQSLFDGWDFWIERDDIELIDLPDELFCDYPWKPIGMA